MGDEAEVTVAEFSVTVVAVSPNSDFESDDVSGDNDD